MNYHLSNIAGWVFIVYKNTKHFKLSAKNFLKFIGYFVKVNQKFKAIEYLSLLLRFHQVKNVNCWKQPRLIPYFQGSLEEFKINICNKTQETIPNKQFRIEHQGHPNNYLFQFCV